MKVKIVRNSGFYPTPWYRDKIGQVFDVKDEGSSIYILTKDIGKFIYKGDAEIMFEPKSGMIFQRYCGAYGFFVQNGNTLKMVHLDGNKISGHDTFGDDMLTSKAYGYPKYDKTYIQKIFEAPLHCNYSNLINSTRGYKVLWESEPEIKELTLQEIADKFGIPVEQVRIKE